LPKKAVTNSPFGGKGWNELSVWLLKANNWFGYGLLRVEFVLRVSCGLDWISFKLVFSEALLLRKLI
jgi:hypothetical protein